MTRGFAGNTAMRVCLAFFMLVFLFLSIIEILFPFCLFPIDKLLLLPIMLYERLFIRLLEANRNEASLAD